MGFLNKVEAKLVSWGLDPDDLFAFSAPKVVKIRNVRMGCVSLYLSLPPAPPPPPSRPLLLEFYIPVAAHTSSACFGAGVGHSSDHNPC